MQRAVSGLYFLSQEKKTTHQLFQQVFVGRCCDVIASCTRKRWRLKRKNTHAKLPYEELTMVPKSTEWQKLLKRWRLHSNSTLNWLYFNVLANILLLELVCVYSVVYSLVQSHYCLRFRLWRASKRNERLPSVNRATDEQSNNNIHEEMSDVATLLSNRKDSTRMTRVWGHFLM